MKIKVVMFAGLRDRTGTGELEVGLGEGSHVGDLLEQLADRWPVLGSYSLVIARNQQVVDRSEMLADGDEVALLPPVSGG